MMFTTSDQGIKFAYASALPIKPDFEVPKYDDEELEDSSFDWEEECIQYASYVSEGPTDSASGLLLSFFAVVVALFSALIF